MKEQGHLLQGREFGEPARGARDPDRSHAWRGLVPRETVLADAALLATVVAVLTLIGVSQITLEAFGYAYITTDGPFWQKLHPATPIAVIALGLRCLASGRPFATAVRLATNDAGVLLYLTGIAITFAFAIVVVKTPVTPLIDTFLLPILFFWLLRDLDERIVRWLAYALVALLAVNALIALAEFLSGWRLITVTVPEGVTADPSRTDAVFDWRADLALEWRATALLGHPIESGGVVGSFILCLAVRGCRWLAPMIRLPLLLLQGLSLFAYGSRLPLVASLGLAAVLGLLEAGSALARGARLSARSWIVVASTVPLLVGGAAAVLSLGVFDRTVDRFVNDSGSATTRITMFRLFDPLSAYDMLFGPNQDLIHTWQRLEGLEYGIESSWVGLTLTYGILVTGILVLGLGAFAASVARASGRGTWFVWLFFLLDVSISTGLSGKTTSVAAVTVLILLFVRRERDVGLPRSRDGRGVDRRY